MKRRLLSLQNIQVWWISPLAWYAGKTWGWQDSRTQFWLREVYERRNADGGYGLGEPWDVGRTLIDGYDGGGVPRERVVEAVASILVPAGREDEALTNLRTWRNFTRANYNRTIGGWTYESGQSVLQDPWHNAATVGPMWEADPTLTEPMPDHFAHWPNTTGANADRR